MALPEFVRRMVETKLAKFCERVPPVARDQVRLILGFRGNAVTIYEERPRFLDSSEWGRRPVARIRFDSADGHWMLYWFDRHQRGHLYDPLGPTTDLDRVLQEINSDPTGIFWG